MTPINHKRNQRKSVGRDVIKDHTNSLGLYFSAIGIAGFSLKSWCISYLTLPFGIGAESIRICWRKFQIRTYNVTIPLQTGLPLPTELTYSFSNQQQSESARQAGGGGVRLLLPDATVHSPHHTRQARLQSVSRAELCTVLAGLLAFCICSF